jgi:hypothetical protein
MAKKSNHGFQRRIKMNDNYGICGVCKEKPAIHALNDVPMCDHCYVVVTGKKKDNVVFSKLTNSANIRVVEVYGGLSLKVNYGAINVDYDTICELIPLLTTIKNSIDKMGNKNE